MAPRASKRKTGSGGWLPTLTLLLSASQASASEPALASHIAAVASTLSSQERTTLSQISGIERQLLALRAYLRAGPQLASRWSWTDEQIREYTRSPEYRRLLQDIDRVRSEFERLHPGYSLYANTQVRSLDVQLGRWHSNPRVGKTAANLRIAAQSALANADETPTQSSIESFKRFLVGWRPQPVAPLAAPGLSAHGQMRAVDFAIMRNGRFVAATNVAAVASDWEAPGWDRKLKKAIEAADANFEGPLKSPNEPWHYEYRGRSHE